MEMLDKVKETEERAKTEKSEAKAKAARTASKSLKNCLAAADLRPRLRPKSTSRL